MTPEEQKKLGERAVMSLLGRRNGDNKKTAAQISEEPKHTANDNTRGR
jgi:hypothetical protein